MLWLQAVLGAQVVLRGLCQAFVTAEISGMIRVIQSVELNDMISADLWGFIWAGFAVG